MILSKKDIIETLDEMLKESERKREKAYDSYCLFPNEINSKEWDKYDKRVAAITKVLNLLIEETKMLIKFTRKSDNKPVYINKGMIMSVCEDYNENDITIIDCSCGDYFKVTETVEEVMAKLEEETIK